jgi:hypothetical protein
MEKIILSKVSNLDIEEIARKDQLRFQSLIGIDVPLENRMNHDYLGELTIGGFSSKNILFDTGSTWLTVTSDLCTNCQSTIYQTKSS